MAVSASMSRIDDLTRLYVLLDRLSDHHGGARTLADTISGNMARRGVYFFFEPEELRGDSGKGARVVRVGTHALKAGASSTLRGRLRQHCGSRSGSGNHRGSIFRLLTGDALIRSGMEIGCPSWGAKDGAAFGLDRQSLKQAELPTEHAASHRIGSMNVIWLAIEDDPGPDSLRGWIERNAIALLSNAGKPPLDAPSADWLGHHSSRPRVRASGLWNQNHVDEAYEPHFLDDLQRLVEDHVQRYPAYALG